MALAVAALPIAAQAKQANSQTSQTASATATDESTIVLPGGSTNAAGATGAAANPTTASSGLSLWDFVRMILIIAAVIGLIYLVFWLIRKGAGKKAQENDLIKVLGSKGLAANRSLHLVEVGSSVYLVGSSDGGVELIAEITDKESLDTLRLQAADQSPAGHRGFQQVLSEIFKPAKKPLSVSAGIGVLKGQRERLRRL